MHKWVFNINILKKIQTEKPEESKYIKIYTEILVYAFDISNAESKVREFAQNIATHYHSDRFEVFLRRMIEHRPGEIHDETR